MTDIRNDDPSMLAAELALGLIEGEERAAAERRAQRDPAFAREVEDWHARLQPMAADLNDQMPPPALWDAIARRIRPARVVGTAPAPAAANDNAALLGKLRVWRLYAGAATGIAAGLALVLGLGQLRSPPAPPAGPVVAQAPSQILMANLSSQALPNSAAIAYDRASSSLLVTPGHWPIDPAHDHQLWIIPPGGEPVRLGLCCERGIERHSIPAELAPHFQARSKLAVSVEPIGGNRSGRPSSAFAVQGELNPI